jgi:nucleotidyltransferase substrate binding protein (TIGR01987 family)
MLHDVRWKQRFQNFDRAVALLREPIEKGVDKLSDLEKEGAVHRFELALELAWKTLKDYLEFSGTIVKPVTPRGVIKEAFAAQILTDGQIWIDMLNHRNLLSHTYDEATYEEAVRAIHERYLEAIVGLHDWLKKAAQ